MGNIYSASIVGVDGEGSEIAYLLARYGINVCLIDNCEQGIRNGIASIENLLEEQVSQAHISIKDAHETMSKITSAQDLEAMSKSDLLIESVDEELELKQHIFAIADALIDHHGLLMSTSKEFSTEQLASRVVQRDRFIGLNFLCSPTKSKIVEIISDHYVSIESLSLAKDLISRIQKECVVVSNSPSFVSLRLTISLALEAIRMLEAHVAKVDEIDMTMRLGYGHRMGPLMLSDHVGLDRRLALAEHLYRSLEVETFNPPNLLRKMVRAGFLGKSSGTGFYEWENGRSLGVSQTLFKL